MSEIITLELESSKRPRRAGTDVSLSTTTEGHCRPAAARRPRLLARAAWPRIVRSLGRYFVVAAICACTVPAYAEPNAAPTDASACTVSWRDFDTAASILGADVSDKLHWVLQQIYNDPTAHVAAVDPGRTIIGPPAAPIHIDEYGDFNCGYCAKAHETMRKLLTKYPAQLSFTYKHLPILAPESRTAAAYMAAIAQGSRSNAQTFYDALFDHISDFRLGGEEYLRHLASEVGADTNVIAVKAASPEVKAFIERDISEAADSTACRATIPCDAGPVFHGMPGHRSTVSRAG